MAKLVLFSALVFVSSGYFVKVCEGGTVAYKHQDTTLDELRSIDSYVSGALPVLRDGFFIGTSRGPVLVKSEPLPGAKNKRPTVNSKYYNTLPRLIPAGFEGIATSYFNLGAATPIAPRPYSPLSKSFVSATTAAPAVQTFLTSPSPPEQYVTSAAVPQQYLSEQTEQAHSHQYFVSHQPPQGNQQPNHFSSNIQHNQAHPQFNAQPEPQQQQFLPEPQQFNQEQQQPQQQPQQYFNQLEQQPQQYNFQAGQQELNQNQQQNFPQQQQDAGQIIDQNFLQFNHHPQQFHVERSVPPQPQQQIQEQPGQQIVPEQDISIDFQQHPQPQQYNQVVPQQEQYLQQQEQPQQQQPQQFNNVHFGGGRSQFSNNNAPNAEPSFQVDNLLKLDKDEPPQTFQRQVFGEERFQSHKLVRNQAVVSASDFEETLPETLKNQFYKSANLATILAQESLPVQGEQIVQEWDTNKITKGKIHALLRGAGLI